mmetsp:Transcript_24195/g.78027  ORF Transcript_24195/g.78027 Transcript_24195/m.78027 type:complete len:292 (+) Transcript_24195:743-1618(+)
MAKFIRLRLRHRSHLPLPRQDGHLHPGRQVPQTRRPLRRIRVVRLARRRRIVGKKRRKNKGERLRRDERHPRGHQGRHRNRQRPPDPRDPRGGEGSLGSRGLFPRRRLRRQRRRTFHSPGSLVRHPQRQNVPLRLPHDPPRTRLHPRHGLHPRTPTHRPQGHHPRLGHAQRHRHRPRRGRQTGNLYALLLLPRQEKLTNTPQERASSFNFLSHSSSRVGPSSLTERAHRVFFFFFQFFLLLRPSTYSPTEPTRPLLCSPLFQKSLVSPALFFFFFSSSSFPPCLLRPIPDR